MIQVDLYKLVLEADDELIKKGILPHQRPLHACMYIADKLQISFTLGPQKSNLVDKVHKIYEDLYRHQDLLGPPVHIGCCLFRDIFLEIKIPLIYGRPGINPVEFLQKNNGRLTEWMFSKRDTGKRYYDQFFDLFDFAYSLDDITGQKSPADRTIEYFFLGKQQLQGAAATVFGSFDNYTAIQSSLYAVELILKGALSAKGFTDDKLKSYSHKLCKLSQKVAELYPQINGVLLQAVCERLPNVIKTRYEAMSYTRIQIGEIIMNAQYVAGEVLRSFSDRNTRENFISAHPDTEWDFKERAFPSLS